MVPGVALRGAPALLFVAQLRDQIQATANLEGAGRVGFSCLIHVGRPIHSSSNGCFRRGEGPHVRIDSGHGTQDVLMGLEHPPALWCVTQAGPVRRTRSDRERLPRGPVDC